MMHPISRRELWHAQTTLLAAIALQMVITRDFNYGPQYVIAALELFLVIGIGLTAPRRHTTTAKLNKTISMTLISLVSFANAGALALLVNALLNGSNIPGHTLIADALAIFLTNMIMFGLWYWEIDSPGLSGHHQPEEGEHFAFPQASLPGFRSWRPTFFDYLYTSLTNSTAFSPTDTLPLTHISKALMGTQAMISLVTVVLVTARAVNILG